MQIVFAALLHASEATRNRRAYRVEAGRDLFGTWLVEATFGRISDLGLTHTFVAGSEGEAREFTRACLVRHWSAP